MTTPFSQRHARQTLVLSAILGLHVAVFWLIATGLAPRLLQSLVPEPPPLLVLPRAEQPIVLAKPGPTDAFEYRPARVAKPVIVVPEFENAASTIAESAPNDAAGPRDARPLAEPLVPPALRTPDRRLAALVDACYPAASRRLGEQGRAMTHVTIGADGRARNWHVGQSTGYSRLDAAVDCVVERLEFEAGKRAGRPVAAEAVLPIVFRLE